MQITDTPIFFPATPPPVGPVTTTIKEESVIKEPAQVVVQRQVSGIYKIFSCFKSIFCGIDEPRHEKTGFLHMRKQRRRSASR